MHTDAEPLIRLEGIAKSFAATFEANGERSAALRNVTLQVERGDIFGIVGRSGAGKSTLLRMINLLETPDAGSVFVAGQDLTRLSRRGLRLARRNIGMIFQGYNLLQNLDVHANVAFPLRLHGLLNAPRLERRVRECLDLVGIGDKAASYPAQLSGGQKQRVAIARALASQPDILLCDEPTSALDAETTRGLLATLREVNASLGVTIVIVSHELPALGALCKRVAVLEDGRVAEQFDLADTSTPRLTALGRELAFHGTEAGTALQGALHA
ncbi:MAG: ATP-binding cassette domain-containing protein [Rubrivivax sp.]|nr:MAG: ATP-binding cassette domain-containing protein [Rubrivivax sp.]